MSFPNFTLVDFSIKNNEMYLAKEMVNLSVIRAPKNEWLAFFLDMGIPKTAWGPSPRGAIKRLFEQESLV